MKNASVLFKILGGLTAVTLVGSFLMMDLLRVKVTEASVLGLPEPNVVLKASNDYSYPILRGVKIDYNNPLNMDFIIDTADQGKVDQEEAQRLINYFYATVAVPNEALWVNLSPYEQDRVVEDSLKETDLGRDLLAQDYVLKQFSSSLTYPKSKSGRDYWEMIKEEAGLANDAFNKIWIMPEDAKINEENGMAWVSEATLTAQLEADYMAADLNNAEKGAAATEAMREIVLPKVIDEINNGKNFSKLRQIYHSMLLGMWFKKRFKESFFANLIEQENVKGIEIADKEAKDKIYKVYKKAFEQGVYRILRNEKDKESSRTVKKEYFSGGFLVTQSSPIINKEGQLNDTVVANGIGQKNMNSVKGLLVNVKSLVKADKVEELGEDGVTDNSGVLNSMEISSSPDKDAVSSALKEFMEKRQINSVLKSDRALNSYLNNASEARLSKAPEVLRKAYNAWKGSSNKEAFRDIVKSLQQGIPVLNQDTAFEYFDQKKGMVQLVNDETGEIVSAVTASYVDRNNIVNFFNGSNLMQLGGRSSMLQYLVRDSKGKYSSYEGTAGRTIDAKFTEFIEFSLDGFTPLSENNVNEFLSRVAEGKGYNAQKAMLDAYAVWNGSENVESFLEIVNLQAQGYDVYNSDAIAKKLEGNRLVPYKNKETGEEVSMTTIYFKGKAAHFDGTSINKLDYDSTLPVIIDSAGSYRVSLNYEIGPDQYKGMFDITYWNAETEGYEVDANRKVIVASSAVTQLNYNNGVYDVRSDGQVVMQLKSDQLSADDEIIVRDFLDFVINNTKDGKHRLEENNISMSDVIANANSFANDIVIPKSAQGQKPNVIVVNSDNIAIDGRVNAYMEHWTKTTDMAVFLAGGASKMSEEAKNELLSVFDALRTLGIGWNMVVGDGGTQAGIMEAAGIARKESNDAFDLVGVSPYDDVALDGADGKTAIDPNHTVVITVKNDPWLEVQKQYGWEASWGHWGSETEAMYKLFGSLTQMGLNKFSVAVVSNGGGITIDEVKQNIDQNRNIILLKGSGRAADAMVALLEGKSLDSLNEEQQKLYKKAQGIQVSENKNLFSILDISQGANALKNQITKLFVNYIKDSFPNLFETLSKDKHDDWRKGIAENNGEQGLLDANGEFVNNEAMGTPRPRAAESEDWIEYVQQNINKAENVTSKLTDMQVGALKGGQLYKINDLTYAIKNADGSILIDTFNTRYDGLSDGWKAKNEISVTAALGGVKRIVESKMDIEQVFQAIQRAEDMGHANKQMSEFKNGTEIEQLVYNVAVKEHDRWMLENEWQKDQVPHLFVDFDQLDASEQYKDLSSLKEALKSYKITTASSPLMREGGISMQELDEKLVLEKGADVEGKMFANIDYDFSEGINYTILAMSDISEEQVLEMAKTA